MSSLSKMEYTRGIVGELLRKFFAQFGPARLLTTCREQGLSRLVVPALYRQWGQLLELPLGVEAEHPLALHPCPPFKCLTEEGPYLLYLDFSDEDPVLTHPLIAENARRLLLNAAQMVEDLLAPYPEAGLILQMEEKKYRARLFSRPLKVFGPTLGIIFRPATEEELNEL